MQAVPPSMRVTIEVPPLQQKKAAATSCDLKHAGVSTPAPSIAGCLLRVGWSLGNLQVRRNCRLYDCYCCLYPSVLLVMISFDSDLPIDSGRGRTCSSRPGSIILPMAEVVKSSSLSLPESRLEKVLSTDESRTNGLGARPIVAAEGPGRDRALAPVVSQWPESPVTAA
jgi:hypothetical protein